MKYIIVSIALMLSVNVLSQSQGCTNAPNGQYPENVYTPNCSGNREFITEYGYSGEYSSVSLTAGILYEFQGSIATDYLTITNEDGSTILISGSNKVTYTPENDQIVRFYLHTNENCGSDYDDLKARSVKCSVVPTSYCEPILDCTDGAAILKVSGQHNMYESGCSTNGYTDYTELPPIMAFEGLPLELAVEVGNGWYEQSVSVWIDFNNNFIFEQDEFFYLGSGRNTTIVDMITMPENVEFGEYRMRIRLATVAENLATWDKSCDVSQYYGETEDYMLSFTPLANTNDLNQNKISIAPNPVIDVLTISRPEKINTISIQDLSGRKIQSTESNKKLNVEHLVPGVYILQFDMKDGSIQTQKLIKK